MSQISRILIVFLIFCLPLVVFSQKPEPKTEESPKSSGLKKIASGRGVDVRINREQLEADIAAVEDALKSMEDALEQLEQLDIHIEPIEINLSKLNFALEPLVIDIPELDINIEPVLIELDDTDINSDVDDDKWNEDKEEEAYHHSNHLKDKAKAHNEKLEKAADKAEERSTKSEKTKAKGLKKIE